MDSLDALGTLGLEIPSPPYIVGAILFGIIGMAVFRRGRTASNAALTWTGVGLMLYPYALSQTWTLWVVGILLCGWAYAKWN